MPYALSNLIDGQVPSYRYVASPTDATPQEVVVNDTDFRDGWVWDAANKRLRARTGAEELEIVKSRKAAEFTLRQLQEIAKTYRPQVKSDDPNAWIAEMLLDVAQALRSVNQTTKLRNASDMRTKRDRGHSAIATKTTIAEVEAMTWEGM